MPAEVAIKNVALTVSTSAIGLTALTAAEYGDYGPPSHVLVQNTSTTLTVAWRDDGTNPTTAGTFFLFPQQSGVFWDWNALKFIRTGASDVTLGVGWYA